MNVKVISREIIKPSNPTPTSHLYDHISLLDQIARHNLVPFIFFYSPNFPNKISTKEMVSQLKESLATTLSIYYPLAGRMEINACPPYIFCNDQGVPYFQGQVNLRVSDVVNKVGVSELDKLLPCNFKAPGRSEFPLVIQVNVFECGGIAIGLCLNHRVCDGFSLYTFVKTWANNNAGRNNYDPLPYFDLAKVFPVPNIFPASFVLEEEEEEEVVTERFMFTAEKLSALKSRYSSSAQQVRVSSGLVLLAFIYSRSECWSKYRNINYEILPAVGNRHFLGDLHPNYFQNINYEIVQAVGIRHLLDHPPPNHFYFGNVVVKALTTRMKKDQFCDVVDTMKESITKIDADFVRKIKYGEENLSFLVDRYVRAKKGEVVLLDVSNHSKLPAYEADFGWGKPIWVTSATIAVEYTIVFMCNPSGKEMEAYISLRKEDMNKLEQDKEFNAFVKRPIPCNL